MPRSKDYKLGYGAGYSAAAAKRRPDYMPLAIPPGTSGEIIKALTDLTEAAHTQLSTFGEDDDVYLAVKPYIEKADDAIRAFNKEFLERLNEYE